MLSIYNEIQSILMLHIFVNNYICMTKFSGIKKNQKARILGILQKENREGRQKMCGGFLRKFEDYYIY